MRRETDARALLNRLLDRHERSDGGRRIVERPSQTFEGIDERRALTEGLQAAADTGSVSLDWDRDAAHLIERVVLVDPTSLYAHLGRTPSFRLAEQASSQLAAIVTNTQPASGLVDDLVDAWSRGAKILGLGHDQLSEAISLVAALDAAFADLPGDVPLRTRSARLLGDSKALERALPTIVSYLRHSGQIDPELPRDEALAVLGLLKYPQPVLVAGALMVGGILAPAWPYVGIPPEMVVGARPAEPVRTLLTVENLESFNRHVRTSMRVGDLVVYSGGFPSNAVIALLRSLLDDCERLHHWGDVDPGGVRIGRHLETALSREVVPHRMEVELARNSGRVPSTPQRPPKVPRDSAFREHAAYLSDPRSPWLEQEVVDPAEVRI